MRIIGSRNCRAGQRQPCYEPSSRNRHYPTCSSTETAVIQART
ncbi:Unknown protein sequence [Pseudomonas savastanoi pv. glycinea]|nr:hypothetical protein AC519_0258 [Pseudomonas savastanoi]KPB34885.1 Unknown protein sequence [Pseudomonas amygdali pv. sesami]KPB40228.1 Unknown protein sequence [Pseudomonas savastanoi pv. phaseolicola]KPB62041.1 Unknown protein sequence [Pseudomonas amygdali pv. myricae]KPB70813.1 Unknown protein sequence [Pseudomonas amygdali pv. mellea]KPB80848.1 Unknown protein sequence [Pseudomonas syringae pv. maculicola]KPC03004.1 Unknown protein sequence [Pseudomonas amygdali pv. lachrymans]KPC222